MEENLARIRHALVKIHIQVWGSILMLFINNMGSSTGFRLVTSVILMGIVVWSLVLMFRGNKLLSDAEDEYEEERAKWAQ